MNWNGIEVPDKSIYFQDDDSLIYCADCRDILSLLPNKSIDIVLTDPPYGINYQSNAVIDWAKKPKIVGDEEFPIWIFDILHPNNALYVFCRWDNLYSLPKPKSFIVWDKCSYSMGDLEHEYARGWEGIAFYPQSGHQFIKRPSDVIKCPRIPPAQLSHPNEKPVELMMQIIINNSADLILDPFMGVGAVLMASKKLGKKCIGIEIEEKYCHIAVGRLRQSVMSLNV